jgi:hypothetical protein
MRGGSASGLTAVSPQRQVNHNEAPTINPHTFASFGDSTVDTSPAVVTHPQGQQHRSERLHRMFNRGSGSPYHFWSEESGSERQEPLTDSPFWARPFPDDGEVRGDAERGGNHEVWP